MLSLLHLVVAPLWILWKARGESPPLFASGCLATTIAVLAHVILVIHLPDVWEPIVGALEASITLDMRNLSVTVLTLVCLCLMLAVFSTPLARPLLWKMAAVCGVPAIRQCTVV